MEQNLEKTGGSNEFLGSLKADDLSSIFENLSDGLLVFNEDLIVTYINRAVERNLHLKRDEVLGQNIFTVFPEIKNSISNEKYTWVLENKKPFTFEKQFTEEPFKGWYKIKVYPERNFFCVYIQNITKKKVLTNKVHDKTDKLNGIVNNSTVPQFFISKDHKIVHWNRPLEKLTKVTAKSVVGTSKHSKVFHSTTMPCMADLILDYPDEDLSSFKDHYKKYHYEKSEVLDGAYECTRSLQTSDDESKCLHFTAAPVKNRDGEFIGAIESVEDVTKLKKLEKNLKNSRKRLRILFKNAPDAYYLSDMEGTFIDGNNTVEKISGYKTSELIGKNLLELGLLDQKELTESALIMAKNALGYSTEPVELLINRKDCKQITVELSTFSLEIMNEKLILGVARDVTARKLAETKIKKTMKEKELLLREVSHRVHNNMQIVSSLLSIQASKLENNEIKEILMDMQHRLWIMGMIHKHIYQSDDFVQIDIHKYVQKLLSSIFTSYGVDIERINFKIEIKDIFMGIDTSLPFGMLLYEIVSNSIKYAFPNNRSGEICVEVNETEVGFELTVKDNGVGLPEDLNIEDPETLGLIVVKALVEQLEGDIHIDGNGGTKYKIIFSELEYLKRRME